MIMTIDEMRSRKRELGYSNEKLSELSGVPVGTLQKIFSGLTKAPRQETIRALENVLKPSFTAGSFPDMMPGPEMMVREESAAFNRGYGSYTIRDYDALPEDARVELIDGRFYDLAEAHSGHQAVAGYIYSLFLQYVLKNGGACMPFLPVDVVLDNDDRTVVCPDVLIICDRNKLKKGRLFGAPDFVLEVLSPSTRKKDMHLKLHKYSNAGVREYWMIDPKKQQIIVYDLEHAAFPVIYSGDDVVPVGIWDGKCTIDFKEVFAYAGFLYDEDTD
jgi:Uma2 family endonuclease